MTNPARDGAVGYVDSDFASDLDKRSLISNHDNPVDMITKTLSIAKFEHCLDLDFFFFFSVIPAFASELLQFYPAHSLPKGECNILGTGWPVSTTHQAHPRNKNDAFSDSSIA
ncbi:hypothetical protein CK203_066320 [Vitis vinifera]|uniref:Uncharacterized protein n=1 Tax=Vitis vinifera TaxID=29760 RepID=A0A438G587_VITVI|nr:hypothetical protein CK203_066320 [Vitis vinifera]